MIILILKLFLIEHYLKKELFELIKKDESFFNVIQDGSMNGLWFSGTEKPGNEWMNARFQQEKDSKNKKRTYNILIAEDEEINYFYLETVLQGINEIDLILHHAKNGKEAVDFCLNNDNINLVLMDIRMPVMNGLEATEKIKAHLPDIGFKQADGFSTTFCIL